MNLIVGFVILLCLYGSTQQADSQPQDLMLQLMGIGITAIAVPGLAFVQTVLVNRRIALQPMDGSDFELIQNRISVCHTAVWLTASIGMIWAFRWHDVVQVTLGLKHWVLIDEALILAPAMLALIASWAIFYDIDRNLSQPQSSALTKTSVPKRIWSRFMDPCRFHFVSIRFGVHIAVVLIPMFYVITAKDLLLLLDSFSPVVAYPLFAVILFLLLLIFPLMVRIVWNTSEPLPNLKASIRKEIAGQGVRVHGIRLWNTQGQIINACVVGFLPWFRQVLISDRLVDLFSESELNAIIRHEAAHLRRRHALTRTGMILLPLALWGLCGQLLHNQPLSVSPMATRFEVSTMSAGSCLAILYGIYLLCLQRYMGHMAEFEADLLACCAAPIEKQSPRSNLHSLCRANQQSMLEALLRLGACLPQHIDRVSLIHPSIRSRIEAIEKLEKQGPEQESCLSPEAVFRKNKTALAIICAAVVVVTTALAC